MPAYNAADYLSRSLPPLIEMLKNNEINEVIVVDDSSTDETSQSAARLGARVIPSGSRTGPGGARNRAAEIADCEILWFVDADVVVGRNAVEKIHSAFIEPGVVAVFGSYDEHPPACNFLSQYKNLIHHYYHNRAPREASTFWTGCGAVHKEAFMQLGGFNEGLKCVEDIDLGYRLRDGGGRILLLSGLRCTHLKEWRLLNLLRTEIFCRAIPWSRMMLTRTGLHNDLNITYGERLRAGLAGLLIITLAGALLGLVHWWVPLIAVVLVAIANRQLLFFLHRRKGPIFALRAALFHQLYYLYSSTAFVWTWIEINIFRLHTKQAAT